MAAMFSKDEIFQLTPSRRATEQLLAENEQLIISTHALTEGDPLYQDSDENYQAFQLTPSRRATLNILQYNKAMKFQLTPSRRATHEACVVTRKTYISTHALTEGDNVLDDVAREKKDFNSRPHGGRLQI